MKSQSTYSSLCLIFRYPFCNPFTRSVRYRSTASVAIENTTNNMIHFVDIPVIANNFGRKMIHKIQPVRHPPQTTPRKILTGLQILNRMMNPTIRSNIVAAVEISVVFTSNVLPNTTSAPTISTSVRPAGNAFRNTLVRKCHCILSLFGWNARKNPGTPIVNMLISDIWDGSIG